ncbi:MAG: UvrB/UvrC motif-containing protein [Planctomycetota bacterium]|nr:UvrB/UvrC motif-containing protein [Planctomycetota bacterium]
MDISKILSEWPYESGQLSCRLIMGEDGEPYIQVRLDMGLLQMRADGRPDGERPHGFSSLLDYYQEVLDENRTAPQDDDPRSEKRSLNEDDCRQLRDEAEMYYRRYIALMVLEDFDRVVRDTTRNLHLLDFIAAHAETEDDRTSLEKFRPYITMMRTRALASQAVKDGEPKAALLAIDEGLEVLRRHFEEAGRPQLFDASNEVQALRGMREALVPKLPVSQKSELKDRLARAIADENYELAAILRDELKQLKE